MEKTQLLDEIRQMSAAGQLSQAEVLSVFSGQPVLAQEAASTKNLTIAEILYYIGGAIVFLGITVLCYQNWDNFSSFLRIFITLGSCVACFIVAAILNR